VSGPRKNSKNLIIVLYLLLCVSCLIWLAAYILYFRPGAAPQGDSSAQSLARLRGAAETPPAESPSEPEAGTSGDTPPRRNQETPGPRMPPAQKPAVSRPPAAGVSSGRREQAAAVLRGKVAIILDDAGYQNGLLKTFMSFRGKLTAAVLPGLPGSAEAARIIKSAGKEMMLHLPMQPRHGENPGPGAILATMDDRTITGLTKKHIDSLPGLKGVNNHMGSLATEDPRIMNLVLGVIRERGLFFIDSRTTADSAGPRIARRLGIPCRERSVFLDNEQETRAIRASFEAGKQIAAKQGWAVMIGHVWCAELADILPALYEEALAEGYEFFFVSELFAGTGGNRDR
jgi:polysaccharide deacetylase 2 family uncharacterized protein YibQ